MSANDDFLEVANRLRQVRQDFYRVAKLAGRGQLNALTGDALDPVIYSAFAMRAGSFDEAIRSANALLGGSSPPVRKSQDNRDVILEFHHDSAEVSKLRVGVSDQGRLYAIGPSGALEDLGPIEDLNDGKAHEIVRRFAVQAALIEIAKLRRLEPYSGL